MRVKHTLWKVENGWLLVPDDTADYLSPDNAQEAVVFKTLKEFADWKPKQRRNRRPKPTPTLNEILNTKPSTMKSAKPGQTESET